jgi:hypothetical protein
MYLDYVLLRPDDGCFTAETCCQQLTVTFCHIVRYYMLCLFVDGNKNSSTKRNVQFINEPLINAQNSRHSTNNTRSQFGNKLYILNETPQLFG